MSGNLDIVLLVIVFSGAFLAIILWDRAHDTKHDHEQILGFPVPGRSGYSDEEAYLIKLRLETLTREVASMDTGLDSISFALGHISSREMDAVREYEAAVRHDLNKALQMVRKFDKKSRVSLGAFGI